MKIIEEKTLGKKTGIVYRYIKIVIGKNLFIKSMILNIFLFLKLFMFYYRNIFSHDECYITCSGKKDGPGAQAAAIISTMLFAEAMHIKYVHTPFVKLQHNYDSDPDWEKKWEDFFNLGKGELASSNIDTEVIHEISLKDDPLRIKKQANTLFVLYHCHTYMEMFPNRYYLIKDKLLEKYYASSKSGYELHYEPNKVNVAIHIRRGDVNANNQFKDKFTENRFIVDVLIKIQAIFASQGVESSLCVYSVGEMADFKELEKLNLKFFLNISPFTTFHNLVCADVLVMSKSTFSYTAALLSKGIVFYESFEHKPLKRWINVNRNAEFNTRIFSIKLQHYMSGRLQSHQGNA